MQKISFRDRVAQPRQQNSDREDSPKHLPVDKLLQVNRVCWDTAHPYLYVGVKFTIRLIVFAVRSGMYFWRILKCSL